jgi:hypothetical protein
MIEARRAISSNTFLHETSALSDCGRYATCLDKKLIEARRATKKNAKGVELRGKKNAWGAGGDEVLAIDLSCRSLCGESALCDCCRKDIDRPIEFGGGGRRY